MIAWNYDRSGLYSSPVIVIEQKFKYLLSNTAVNNIDQFHCVHGCPAIVKLETTHEEDENGWETVTKSIIELSPLTNHHCQSHINKLETLDHALSCFSL